MSEKSFSTLTVHAGEDLTENHGAVSVPIYNASVFAFSDADTGAAIHNHQREGYFYGRLGNPTQTALERAMRELENGEDALAFASGMAAVSAAVLTLVKSGDHIVAPDSMYSTTTNFFNELSEKFGIETTFVDAVDAENYAEAARPETKIFWLETPSNPLLKITDIEAVAKIAKEKNIKTIADNTFATPFNQRPLKLGVDLVIHSATKYLGGHSDLTAGLIVGKREIVEKARLHTTKLYGGNIAPQTAWLVLRGIKTLALRMERHNQNASAIANMLSAHPKVKAVFYPGLEKHQNHEIAAKQMKGFGGMVAFDVGGTENGKNLVNNVEICTLATSLGGVETIIQHSASMTHATLSREDRLKAGVTDGLIRLSVGIEDEKDLIADLENALNQI
ncbi:MAG TPA: PLP-dependent aspartate aminotransferase family protein [Pyrinomonadaceae bacterium]|nr:PLP-dependent aspartate aminotransferase family protein [Pyrinomonadaceae bacterium]